MSRKQNTQQVNNSHGQQQRPLETQANHGDTIETDWQTDMQAQITGGGKTQPLGRPNQDPRTEYLQTMLAKVKTDQTKLARSLSRSSYLSNCWEYYNRF